MGSCLKAFRVPILFVKAFWGALSFLRRLFRGPYDVVNVAAAKRDMGIHMILIIKHALESKWIPGVVPTLPFLNKKDPVPKSPN